ncbi:MAG: hypothetical protein A2X46_04880 [Lentisphaerae bacterium GWF2_57_35]|nr:MAG: hypothetical protein A2X46_04880 [Lentisphaerae bacterium GWF2_57_35]
MTDVPLFLALFQNPRTVIASGLLLICLFLKNTTLLEGALSKGKRLSRRPILASCVLFVLALIAVVLPVVWKGAPIPFVHDEFSYLLAADTFASGRVANPAPPCSDSMESMHILVRPVYMSKYPPGQGLVLGLGQVLAGMPILGIWIIHGLAVVGIYWMLQAFVSSTWSFLGGLLVSIHPLMIEWSYGYWGGTLGVLGGALLIGGAARIGTPRIISKSFAGICFALGALILANFRPFEGFVLFALIALALFIHLKSKVFAGGWWRQAIPILVLGSMCMGYYNWRVTGTPFRLPYEVHHSQYGAYPLFLFQRPWTKPVYFHKELDRFYDHEQRDLYMRRESGQTILRGLWYQATELSFAAFKPFYILALPLTVLPLILPRSRKVLLWSSILLMFMGMVFIETYMAAHYVSPVFPLLVALIVISMNRALRWKSWGSSWLVRSVVVVYFFFASCWMKDFALATPSPSAWYIRRAHLQANWPMKFPGKHLFFVRYSFFHDTHKEWVYNGSDLENASVIWVRDMDIEKNNCVLTGFPDRQAWIVNADQFPVVPVCYSNFYSKR